MYPLDSVITISNLGNYIKRLEIIEAAELYLKNALEIRQELLGENHPNVAQSMTNLGKIVS